MHMEVHTVSGSGDAAGAGLSNPVARDTVIERVPFDRKRLKYENLQVCIINPGGLVHGLVLRVLDQHNTLACSNEGPGLGLDRPVGAFGVHFRPTTHSRATHEYIANQDGQTLVIATDGERTRALRVGSMIDSYYVPDDPRETILRIASPRIDWVFMTVTEGGYSLTAPANKDPLARDLTRCQDVFNGKSINSAPETIYGLMALALYQRKSLVPNSPFVALSGDNFRSNGDRFRAGLDTFLDGVSGSAPLKSWMATHFHTVNTMVDCIVPNRNPSTPEGAEFVRRVQETYGVTDTMPFLVEDFVEFVIDERILKLLPTFPRLDLSNPREVRFVSNVAAEEEKKLRLFNAIHTSLVYAALVARDSDVPFDQVYVADAVKDTAFARLLGGVWRDAIPAMSEMAANDCWTYAGGIWRRLQNKDLGDAAHRISANGSTKVPERVLSSLVAIFNNAITVGHEVTADQIRALTLSVAMWARYLDGRAENGEDYSNQIQDVNKDTVHRLGRIAGDKIKDSGDDLHRAQAAAFEFLYGCMGVMAEPTAEVFFHPVFQNEFATLLVAVYKKGVKQTIMENLPER